MKLRLCIRDSLFRLAQSAMQRQYATDTFSTNKSSRDEHDVVQEEINSRNRLVHPIQFSWSMSSNWTPLFYFSTHGMDNVTFMNLSQIFC
jgi:flagella basal body P-ring formation protein FlgA